MLPRSMSTRTLSAGTNKMSITYGYLHRAGLRPRRRLQLVQHQRLRLRQQRPPHLQLRPRRLLHPRLQLLPQPLRRPHQHQQLLLLPDRRRRRDLSPRRDRAPRHAPVRSYRRSIPVLAGRRASTERGGYKKNLPTRALCEFSDQSSHQLIGDNSRQDCCSGLGKRASAAIRDYESGIRSRVRFITSILQPLHTL
jgi:hypothetical protein